MPDWLKELFNYIGDYFKWSFGLERDYYHMPGIVGSKVNIQNKNNTKDRLYTLKLQSDNSFVLVDEQGKEVKIPQQIQEELIKLLKQKNTPTNAEGKNSKDNRGVKKVTRGVTKPGYAEEEIYTGPGRKVLKTIGVVASAVAAALIIGEATGAINITGDISKFFNRTAEKVEEQQKRIIAAGLRDSKERKIEIEEKNKQAHERANERRKAIDSESEELAQVRYGLGSYVEFPKEIGVSYYDTAKGAETQNEKEKHSRNVSAIKIMGLSYEKDGIRYTITSINGENKVSVTPINQDEDLTENKRMTINSIKGILEGFMESGDIEALNNYLLSNGMPKRYLIGRTNPYGWVDGKDTVLNQYLHLDEPTNQEAQEETIETKYGFDIVYDSNTTNDFLSSLSYAQREANGVEFSNEEVPEDKEDNTKNPLVSGFASLRKGFSGLFAGFAGLIRGTKNNNNNNNNAKKLPLSTGGKKKRKTKTKKPENITNIEKNIDTAKRSVDGLTAKERRKRNNADYERRRAVKQSLREKLRKEYGTGTNPDIITPENNTTTTKIDYSR